MGKVWPNSVQASFRIRDDDGSESGATWLEVADDDHDLGTISGDVTIRVRFLIQETNGSNENNDPNIYCSIDSGAYASLNGDTTYIIGSASGYLTNEDPTTQQIGAGSYLTSNSWVIAADNDALAPNLVMNNNECECEICLKIVYADWTAATHTLDFRLYNGTTALDTYTVTPRISFTKAAGAETASPFVGAVSTVGNTHTVTYELELTATPTNGVIETVGYAPSVTVGAEQEVLPSTGVVNVVGNTPTVTYDAPPLVCVSDDFNRANESLADDSEGRWATATAGNNYVVPSITSNALRNLSGTAAAIIDTAYKVFSVDQEVKAYHQDIAGFKGVGVLGRFDTDTNNGYGTYYDSNEAEWYLYRYDAGDRTAIDSVFNPAILDSGTMRLVLQGDNIDFYYRDALLLNAVDDNYKTGQAGVILFGNNAILDDFVACDYTEVTTKPSVGIVNFVGNAPTLELTIAPTTGVINFVGNTPTASIPQPEGCVVFDFEDGTDGDPLTGETEWTHLLNKSLEYDGDGNVRSSLTDVFHNALIDPDYWEMTANQSVELQVYGRAIYDYVGAHLRWNESSSSGLFINFNNVDDEILVFEQQSQSSVTIVNAAYTFGTSQTYTLYASIVGSTISLRVGGVEVTSVESTKFSAGQAGIALYTEGTTGTDIRKVTVCDDVGPSDEVTTTPSVGVVNITGNTPTVEVTVNVEPTTGVLNEVGYAPTLELTLLPTNGLITIQGQVPTVTRELELTVNPTNGVITTTGYEPTLEITLRGVTGNNTIVGETPSIDVTKNLLPANGVLEVTGYTPLITTGTDLVTQPSIGNVDIVGNAPTTKTEHNLKPNTGNENITGYAPTVDTSVGPQTTAPTNGVVNIVGETPSLDVTHDVAPTHGVLETTGYAPTVEATTTADLSPTNGVVTITGDTPSLEAINDLVSVHGLIVITGDAPTTEATTERTTTPSVGNLTIVGGTHEAVAPIIPSGGLLEVSGETPSLEVTHNLTPANNVISIVGLTPSPDTGQQYAPTTGLLTTEGLAPVVDLRWWVPDVKDDVTWTPDVAASSVWAAIADGTATWTPVTDTSSLWTRKTIGVIAFAGKAVAGKAVAGHDGTTWTKVG